jgi:hypothetical protein
VNALVATEQMISASPCASSPTSASAEPLVKVCSQTFVSSVPLTM